MPRCPVQKRPWGPIFRSISERFCVDDTPTVFTEVPSVPTPTVTAGDAFIDLAISRAQRARGYNRRIRRRTTNNRRWSNRSDTVDLGKQRTERITQFNASDAIENNRRYQVSVQAYNEVGNSAWSGWEEVTPLN